MILRPYHPEDCPALLQLFHDTVHAVNAQDYSPEQLCAWAPPVEALILPDWQASLAAHEILVAEENGQIAGFADLDGSYLDRLYVHKDFQRRGAAALLASALENRARENGFVSITVHASLTAHGFFTRRGYQTIRRQTVVCRGVSMDNYVMEKKLGG